MQPPYHLPTEVDRIATHTDPVLRNLQITQSYYELSTLMARRSGSCANWCTFATWASKQAGQSIRQEDLRRALDQALSEVPETREAVADLVEVIRQKHTTEAPDRIRQVIRDAISPVAAQQRAGDAVARGNQKVYTEIGRAFARFLETCSNDAAYDATHIEQFCGDLRAGDPPEGQVYLQRAFTRYYRAFFVEDAREKAQLMLLANLEIGFHEQTRLQPEIAEALEAAVADPQVFARRLLVALFPYRGWLVYAGWMLMRWLGRRTALDQAVGHLPDRIRQHIRLFLTRHLMALHFSGGRTLRLGTDLRAVFPENLRTLDHPELLAMLAQLDPTQNDLRDSGAADWANLGERLHFIADLFRCSQEEADLLEAPFPAQQVEEIKTGVLVNREW